MVCNKLTLKMKHLKYTILISLLSSCSKTNDNQYIELSIVDNFFPDEYKTGSKAVFVNSSRKSLTLSISYLDEVSEQTIGTTGLMFLQDNFFVNLTTDTGKVGILVNGSAFVNSDLSEIRPFVSYLMRSGTSISNSSLQMEARLETNQVVTTCDGNFDVSKSILGREFFNVYGAVCAENQSFSELYVNEEFGIVGFKDDENELWAFDKFEN